MSGRPKIGTYEVHLPKGVFACESCTKHALANSPTTAYAYRAAERHDCELRFEGVCDEGGTMTRTILIHLNVELPSDDKRTADEMASFVLGILKGKPGCFPEPKINACVPLAEEV
jgi:hypothetical protein